MRFSLKWMFVGVLVIAVIFASLRLVTSEARSDEDVYVEYLGTSDEEVENRLVAILEEEGFDEVAGWDPTLSPIPTEPPLRGGGEKEVFVLPDRYFEKAIAGGKIGCALGVDLDYYNKGVCQCRTRSYFSGRVVYWRWTPLDERNEPATEVAQIGQVVLAHHLIALKETSELLFGDENK